MSIRHLFHTIGMLAINAVLVILPLTLAPIMLPVMFLLGFPLLAFINSYFFVGIFDKYMPEKEEIVPTGEWDA